MNTENTNFYVGPAFEELSTEEMMLCQGSSPAAALTNVSSVACGIGSCLVSVAVSITITIMACK